ncbi:MAG TPA: BatD family protein, partial [Balneolales bacterium]|nr:BatD family protein [Balneolales bacterium]
MVKTGKGVLRFSLVQGFFLFLLLIAGQVFAQSVKVNGTISETEIYSGERVILKIEVSGKNFNNVSNPNLPQLNGLQYLSKTPSTSTSYSIVNGVSSRSYSYSYYLQAEKPGKYTIPSVSVKVDGKTYHTKPIQISILNRNKAANNKSNKGKRPDIFLRMEISNHQPYMGQQITARIVLYFKSSLDVLSYQPNPGWKAVGFWKEEYDQTRQPRAISTIIHGVRYRKAVLMKYALFPTKNHTLTISPYEVNCSVQYSSNQQDPFSSFFGGFGGSQRDVDLKTDPVRVDVRDLPPLPKGTQDIGAVGHFTITRTASNQQVELGKTVQITTHIKGAGNI